MQLLESSTATGAGLVGLILAFGPVSGAHFNPLVTLAARIFGGLATGDAAVYAVAQVVGGCVGAIVANLMFDLPAATLSSHARSSAGLWLGETVATSDWSWSPSGLSAPVEQPSLHTPWVAT
ncbi:MAG: aquaporin [Acidimicrobiales bacterium]